MSARALKGPRCALSEGLDPRTLAHDQDIFVKGMQEPLNLTYLSLFDANVVG